MSSSWSKKRTIKYQNYKKPSLTDIFSPNTLHQLFRKRIRNFSSYDRKNSGSMTIEASIIVPIILFFVLYLLSAIEMMRLHSRVELALWDISNQLSITIPMLESNLVEIPDIAIAYLYVNKQLERKLGIEYLESSPIKKNLLYFYSYDTEIPNENDCIQLSVGYQVTPIINFFKSSYSQMENKTYQKTWSGYSEDVAQDEKYVYITEHGEVWHTIISCTYLTRNSHVIKYEYLNEVRNKNGERYYRCTLCGKHEVEEYVYVTDSGNRYHLSSTCSSLTRNIFKILWEDRNVYRPCRRCSQ